MIRKKAIIVNGRKRFILVMTPQQVLERLEMNIANTASAIRRRALGK